MNWNRWSAFFCLAGLAAFVPAVFVPAMLVANAVDGPRWYSVWSGIRQFYQSGELFLAGLIFSFSLVFPLVKFTLGLVCTAGRRFLSPEMRCRIVAITSWTAKYSMLDVMVIAMLVMLVKVNEYVRILPSLGLYLFSAAILLSALSGAALRRALVAEARPDRGGGAPRAHLRAPAWLVMAGLAGYLTFHSAVELRREMGGQVDRVALTRLTHRGDLRRSVEKTLALKELIKEEHDFFSKDTLKRIMEFGQAVSTDAGWKAPEAWVSVEKQDGSLVVSNKITPVDLDDRMIQLTFNLPQTVDRGEIAAVRLVSNIEIAKVIDAPIDEETIRRADDPFRDWTRTWHGRIFSLELQGSASPRLPSVLARLGAGATLLIWCLAALLTPAAPLAVRSGPASQKKS
ncbi:MAG: putative paraquat-inducible protein [Verrucomicrobiales bacterium]|nr:putative paraquat-inducible protein [Verrucomicrobiales bacterium]